MKSLSEQVEEIKNSNVSMNNKKKALIELGICNHELSILLDNKRTKKETYTFGVEIECLIERGAITRQLEQNNVKFAYEGYNHTDNKSYFKFVSDSSIHGENPIECVSPILLGKKGMNDLRKCCNALNEAGANVNKSTGLHVHVGAESLTDEEYINVFKNYKSLEIIIDSFMANSRRGNNSQWCRTLRDHNFDGCTTKRDVLSLLNYDRYHRVNPVAYERHHTIEFRQHQGTIDYEKISNWVNFCIKLVDYSKNHVIDSDSIRTIDEIPFLNEDEKTYFDNRKEYFNNRYAAL